MRSAPEGKEEVKRKGGEAVNHAAEEGKQVWDAAREKNRKLWQTVTGGEAADKE